MNYDPDHRNRSFTPVIIGTVLSVPLLFATHTVVTRHLIHRGLIGILAVAGSLQAVIQLVCFLRIGWEERPYRNLWMFLFMAVLIAILVAGSMWIMHHLAYNTMHVRSSR
ncbi:MAG: hypothetical protein OXF02_05905 [Simkaniaceae bacterium]|nr:hypothetical protein [Simkaniaceae bacterium]